MIKQNLIFIFITILFQSFTTAQSYNQTDEQGNRHGSWRKFFKGSTQLRYEGTFEHGKEVGVFKFYDEDSGSQPTATKTYTAGSDILDVTMYTKDGKIVSQGTMKGRSREGAWTYYHQDGKTVMVTENYKNDLLQGERNVYFINSKLAQRQLYQNGKQTGEELQYSEKGVLLQRTTYVEGKLHGLAQYYDVEGSLLREGMYKNNMRHGTWKYYTNGKLDKTEKFPKNKIGL